MHDCYYTRTGGIAFVGDGPTGNFTIYVRTRGRRSRKTGNLNRLRIGKKEFWYGTYDEAEQGLKELAQKYEWQRL